MNEDYKFEELHENDIELAYSIICWQADYLKNKGIAQYKEPYPSFEILRERQQLRYNYGIYEKSTKNLAAISSVIPNFIPQGWIEQKPNIDFAWITSLFVSKNFKGQNIGYFLMSKIEDKLINHKAKLAVLDCYIHKNEFLINYYKQIGYNELVRKKVVYPIHSFNAALMIKSLM